MIPTSSYMQEHPDLGPCYAHSGMLAVARAVWADLQRHGILQVLILAKMLFHVRPLVKHATCDTYCNACLVHFADSSCPQLLSCMSPSLTVMLRLLQALMTAEAESAASRRGTTRPSVRPTQATTEAVGQQAQQGLAAEVSCGMTSNVAAEMDVQPPSPSRSAYTAAIRSRGLHRREWKLVVTGGLLSKSLTGCLSLGCIKSCA